MLLKGLTDDTQSEQGAITDVMAASAQGNRAALPPPKLATAERATETAIATGAKTCDVFSVRSVHAAS